jgi:hypothetical protein
MTYYGSSGCSGYGAPSSMSSPYSSYGGQSSYFGGYNSHSFPSSYGGSHNIYNLQMVQQGYIGTADINYIRNNNVRGPLGTLDPDYYVKTKNSTDIGDIDTHRTTQELLRDKYNYYSDQKAWNANNYAMHNYYDAEAYKRTG